MSDLRAREQALDAREVALIEREVALNAIPEGSKKDIYCELQRTLQDLLRLSTSLQGSLVDAQEQQQQLEYLLASQCRYRHSTTDRNGYRSNSYKERFSHRPQQARQDSHKYSSNHPQHQQRAPRNFISHRKIHKHTSRSPSFVEDDAKGIDEAVQLLSEEFRQGEV